MTALPSLTFQSLREDNGVDERGLATAGRALQGDLQMHGVANGRAAGAKRKPDDLGAGSSALIWTFFVFLLCGIVLTLLLTLG